MGLVPQLLASIPYSGDRVALRLYVDLSGPAGVAHFGYEGDIDTGFSGGLRGGSNLHQVLDAMGFEAYDSSVRLADKKRHPAWVYDVDVVGLNTSAGDVSLPVPVPTVLVCFSEGASLVGFALLSEWVVELDGPNATLRIFLP